MDGVIFNGWEEEEVPRTYKDKKWVYVPKGSKFEVCKGNFECNESTSISGIVSIKTCPNLSTS